MIITIVAGFALAFGLWWLNEQDIGYIYINVLGWQLETPAVVALVVLVLSFIALYIVVRLIGGLVRTPKRIRQWADKQSTEKAHQQTARGYTALIEGDWDQAERKLVDNASKHTTPVLNYIAAANAAQQRGDYPQRDRYLRLALEADPDGRRAIGLTKARLQYEAGQLAQAQATLHALRHIAPDNANIVRLLIEVQRELGDWEGLQHALPHSRQLHTHDPDELNLIEQETHQHLLLAPLGDDELDDSPVQLLDERWKQLTAKQRKDPVLIATYVEQLITHNELVRAEKELRTTLKREWHPDLAYLYGKAIGSQPTDQLTLAKEWENLHPDDPDLLLTLGRIAAACEMWSEARAYLKAAIEHGGRDEARAELGALLEHLGETDEALSTYRDGMTKIAGAQPSVGLLPAPES